MVDPACRARSVTAFSQSACAGSTILGEVGPTGVAENPVMPTRISEAPITR